MNFLRRHRTSTSKCKKTRTYFTFIIYCRPIATACMLLRFVNGLIRGSSSSSSSTQGPRKVTKSGGQREGAYGERGSASL